MGSINYNENFIGKFSQGAVVTMVHQEADGHDYGVGHVLEFCIRDGAVHVVVQWVNPRPNSESNFDVVNPYNLRVL